MLKFSPLAFKIMADYRAETKVLNSMTSKPYFKFFSVVIKVVTFGRFLTVYGSSIVGDRNNNSLVFFSFECW